MNAVPDKAIIEEVALNMGIDPAFVEKDWYVVQLIKEIISLKLFGAQTIFAGGTALSKAHHLLQRFSEDIDFRLLLPENEAPTKSVQTKDVDCSFIINSRLFRTILYCSGHFNLHSLPDLSA